jgi:hypothetical protein
MTWIKRNLVLFLSGIISLGLIGYGGWYWWTAVGKNAQVDEEIGRAKHELEELMNSAPFPSASNQALAKRELQRLTTFIQDSKKQFPAAPPPAAPLNNQSFKALLQTTVDDLTKEAASVAVRVETNYYFSFEAQRAPMTFPPESLRPMAERLHEIKTITSLLIKAKITRLEGIRRAHVAGETASGNDYLTEAPRHNSELGMTVWPYEYTIQCFTPELAVAMENLMRAPEAIIIRSVVVEPAEALVRPAAPGPVVVPGFRGAAAPRPAPAPALETILNERILRVILKLDVVKPEGGESGSGGRGSGGPRGLGNRP